ncbi:MAG: glucose-1-phosphate adenylyltransferase family protein [bacterium]
MKNVLAMILAGGRVDELSVLTLTRPKSAVPFGGMYRVIDFVLSNLMHSGVERIGILSQYRSFALIHHIGIGSWWDFVGRNRGVTMLPPSTGHNASDWYKGTGDAVYQNLDFIYRHHPVAVLIISGDHIYRMDYQYLLSYHREKEADLTIAFLPIKSEESHRFGVAEIDDEDGKLGGRVLDYKEKPTDLEFKWASLTIYVFRPSVLYEVLEENARGCHSHEFGRDIIPKMLGKYKVYGYKFNGYWAYARTIDEYWQSNMELLGEHPKIDLEAWEVRTNLDHSRLRDRAPAWTGSRAVLEDSLIHNGCRVEGEVHRSILFPGVKIDQGAKVSDSILFFDTVVKTGSVLDKTITDCGVRIGAGCYIGKGDKITPNREYPKILASGINLIGQSTEIPSGIQIGRNSIIFPSLKEKDFRKGEYESGIVIR